jgi:hypothetical protein
MAEMNEWTVMYFFAGDNELSPLVVSQLKAIKDAGYQENTAVLVHFDSNAKGAPTRLYEVNGARKRDPGQPKTKIGDGNDPYVRNMVEDHIDPGTIDGPDDSASVAIRKALQRPDEVNARDALTNFIGYCRENYRAKHYLLFLVGHGLVVGNDAFLPDDSPQSAITLKEFGTILGEFSQKVREEGGEFEMIALHSCSMSAIEVAYQLKGTANYMMASEGTSFVGSWPYRQLLKKIFNTVEEAKGSEADPRELVRTLLSKLYKLTLYNATDFMLSGYSLDLCLCNLAEEKFANFREPFQNLVRTLKESLYDERGKELIQLAHLESQSYWREDYTDLFDFCHCLRRKCNEGDALQRAVKEACDAVIGKEEAADTSSPFNALVVHSDNFGSKYQYSHGLSIYFPWSEPTDDKPIPTQDARRHDGSQPPEEETRNGVMRSYREYAFTIDFEANSWFSFLKSYFEKTQRDSRADEKGGGFTSADLVPIIFDPFGALGPGIL